MSDLVIADVSEFQGTVDWHAYVAAGFSVAIMRAHNGYRADRQWAANRAAAHAAGVRALGIYQYVAAGVDVVAQANALCDLIGALQPGEWPICDLEEGAGDQSARAHAWYATVAARLGAGASEELYSGEYFFNAHRLAAAGFKRIWLAAYSTREPGEAHELWQFTDARSFSGIPGSNDASVFHGTVDQLLAIINPQGDDMPYTPQQLVEFAQQGAAAAIQAERGERAADNLWWWQHAISGVVPAGASPAAAAAITAIHAAVKTLQNETAPTPPAKP